MNATRTFPVVCLLALLPIAGSRADIVDAAEAGFTIEHRLEVAVGRQQAWQAVVRDVGDWWDGDHTVTGNAGNLYIDAVPMGCFCERLGEDGGLVHLMVTFVNPGVMLRLTGGLGPLGLMGINGNLTFEFSEHPDVDGHAIVVLRYAVGGYVDGGLDALAGPVDAVLGEQIQRLGRHLAGADGA